MMGSIRSNYSARIYIINEETIRFVWLVQSHGLRDKRAKAVLGRVATALSLFMLKTNATLCCVVTASSGDCGLVVCFVFFWEKMLRVSVVLILSFLWCSDHLVNVFFQVFISLLFPHPLVHADTHTQGSALLAGKAYPRPSSLPFDKVLFVKLITVSEDVTESMSHNFPFIKSDIEGALWGGLRKKYAANKRWWSSSSKIIFLKPSQSGPVK